MGIKRKPFQGIYNIIRFNWHFYAIIVIIIILGLIAKNFLPLSLHMIIVFGLSLAILTTITSLLASFFIYDVSDLYQMNWLESTPDDNILNINAGFDETSSIIRSKHQSAHLTICDFYDPKTHTEVSIKRARKAYPPQKHTIKVKTTNLPFEGESFEIIIAMLSTHEIRNEKERILFFKELKRLIKPGGTIYVTEHLRDINNFLAYTIGFLHFYSDANWKRIFKSADLNIYKRIKTTPFITTYMLKA